MNFETGQQYLGQAAGSALMVQDLQNARGYIKEVKLGEWSSAVLGPKMTERQAGELFATMPDFPLCSKLDKKTIKRTLIADLKLINVKRYALKGVYISAKAVNKTMYYSNLDTTADPVEYIKLLGLYPAAGIGLALNSDGTFKYCNGEADRNTYALYIQRAYEKAIFKYVKDAFDALDISRITDEPTLLASYTTMINSTLNEVKKWIYKSWPIKVSGNGFTPYTVYSKIPSTKYEGPVITIDGKEYSCQAALAKYVDMAKTILDMNISKVGSRLLQVSDPAARIAPTAFISDPSQNPFLAYDPSLTKDGQAGFRDVSTSTAQKTQTVYTASPDIAPAKYFEMEPALRQYATRDIPIIGGGSLSQKDVDDIRSGGGNYLIPAIAAIAIGAVVATQL